VNFSSEDVPISTGVILDHSGSMTNKLGKAKEAMSEFFKAANPEDEFFLVGFNDHSKLLSSFTDNGEDLQSRVLSASAKPHSPTRCRLPGPQSDEESTQRQASSSHHLRRRR
jgi:hypothetical protein